MKALTMSFMLILACLMAGCTVNNYASPNGNGQAYAPQAQPQNYAPAASSIGIPGKGQQPPVGFKTKRSTLTRIDGFKINYWGFPGQPLNPPKAAAIQKWICSGKVTYNVFFEREAEARAFVNSQDRSQQLSQWRAYLDSATRKPDAHDPDHQIKPDPSRPGAEQVYHNQ